AAAHGARRAARPAVRAMHRTLRRAGAARDGVACRDGRLISCASDAHRIALNRLLAEFRNAMTLHHLKINRFRFHWLQMRCIEVKRIVVDMPIFGANGAFLPRSRFEKNAAPREFKRIIDFHEKRQTIAPRPKAGTGCAASSVISAGGGARHLAPLAAPTGVLR
ncbi:hypothetical protein, partial [Burkholderia thailandensis]